MAMVVEKAGISWFDVDFRFDVVMNSYRSYNLYITDWKRTYTFY